MRLQSGVWGPLCLNYPVSILHHSPYLAGPTYLFIGGARISRLFPRDVHRICRPPRLPRRGTGCTGRYTLKPAASNLCGAKGRVPYVLGKARQQRHSCYALLPPGASEKRTAWSISGKSLRGAWAMVEEVRHDSTSVQLGSGELLVSGHAVPLCATSCVSWRRHVAGTRYRPSATR